jgi:hypothetical protein
MNGTTSTAAIDLRDVQGLILRGYTMPVARHIGLAVREAAGARAFLAALTGAIRPSPQSPRPSRGWSSTTPASTSASPFRGWERSACRRIRGRASRRSMPRARCPGRRRWAKSATALRSTGWAGWPIRSCTWRCWSSRSRPRRWSRRRRVCSRPGPGAAGNWGGTTGRACPVTWRISGTGTASPSPPLKVFRSPGFPTTCRGRRSAKFLLGYPSQFRDHTYPVPTPPPLGTNGSFAALRVLEQDVDAFAEFLTRQAARTGMSAELIAAKLCGRWRNGTPLVLSPGTDAPDPPISPRQGSMTSTMSGSTTTSGVTAARWVRMPARCTRADHASPATAATGTASSGVESPTVRPTTPRARGTATPAGCSGCSSAPAWPTSSSS